MTNSPLVVHTRLSPNRSSPRNQPISKITVHHWANGTGNSTIESIGAFLDNPARQASYNYGIDRTGRVGLYVEERDRCWGSSSSWNDHRAVVVGVANITGAPDWPVNDTTWNALVDLCVDICRRNPGITQKDGKPGLYFDNTQNGSLTFHDMFSRTTCPGPFIRGRAQGLCDEVNARLNAETDNQGQTIDGTPLRHSVSKENVQHMVELDVINSSDYWRGVDSVQWLDELLSASRVDGRLDSRIDNGIADIEVALKVLQDAGIMNSPDYWRTQVETSGVQFLGQLIINIANRSRDVLERIIWAEARGEDLTGQILVANVILNRHRSTKFHNGIHNVVFANGINSQGEQVFQFSPIGDGSYERATPVALNKQAVDHVLDGVDYSQGALFFRTIRGAEGSWHERALTKLFDHGTHRFYA